MIRSKNMYILDSEEEALIMGSLLGDSCLSRTGNSARLKVEHSIKQTEFVKWKHMRLSKLCKTTQGPKIRYIKNTNFSTLYFESGRSPSLIEMHSLFYKLQPDGKYKKIITQELIDKLPINPLVLAVWWMDDGSVRNDCYSGKLATQAFSLEENVFLCSYLKKYEIITEPVYNDKEKNQFYIPIHAEYFPKFIEIIESIVKEIPSMEYKLNAQRKPRND